VSIDWNGEQTTYPHTISSTDGQQLAVPAALHIQTTDGRDMMIWWNPGDSIDPILIENWKIPGIEARRSPKIQITPDLEPGQLDTLVLDLSLHPAKPFFPPVVEFKDKRGKHGRLAVLSLATTAAAGTVAGIMWYDRYRLRYEMAYAADGEAYDLAYQAAVKKTAGAVGWSLATGSLGVYTTVEGIRWRFNKGKYDEAREIWSRKISRPIDAEKLEAP